MATFAHLEEIWIAVWVVDKLVMGQVLQPEQVGIAIHWKHAEDITNYLV